MAEDHAQAVDRSFSAQPPAFEDRRFNRVLTTEVGWLFERLALESGYVALDVAAGTGHAARFLAPAVRAVLALDVTAAMLGRGKLAAEQAGLGNVIFLRGDAASLPFLDASFDIVVCRFAVHHFERPAEQLAEMIRCLAPGGQLVVADLVSGDDTVIARAQDELERLRDPSHSRLLTAGELRVGLELLGARVVGVDMRETERPLAPWLGQTTTSERASERIVAALRTEIEGGPPTGLRPRERDGELWFAQRFASVTATKPGQRG